MNPFLYPTDQSINLSQKNQITDLLLDISFQDLEQKYDKKKFFQLVADLHVDDEIILLREMMIANFTPDKATGNIPVEKKDELIDILATNSTAPDFLTKLQQIDSTLTLPQNFNAANYQLRASEIANAMKSLKIFIAEQIAGEYLGNVNFFLTVSAERLESFSREVNAISAKLITEYENLTKTGQVNKDTLEEAIKFIERCGRTRLSTDTLREKPNLGVISDIISKIDRSIKIVQQIHKLNMVNPTSNQINLEILKYLISDTHL